jgi:hypothetical protein
MTMSNLREKSQLEPGRYTPVWNNPIGLIPLTLLVAVGSLLLLIPIHASYADGKWIGYIICGGLFTYMMLFLKGYFTFSYDLYLQDERIRSFSMLRQVFKSLPEWNLRYEDIDRIVAHSNFGAWMVELTPREGSDGTKLYVSSGIIDFGDFVEQVLDRATNCREVKNVPMLKKFIDRSDIWEKEPDWTIINRAIRRAEENAAKA